MVEKEKKDKVGSVSKAMLAVGDGVLVGAILIMLGVYSGQFLDQKLNTIPWFSTLLPLVGGGLGLARMVVNAINLDKDKAKDEL